jgi:hypothetical protein
MTQIKENLAPGAVLTKQAVMKLDPVGQCAYIAVTYFNIIDICALNKKIGAYITSKCVNGTAMTHISTIYASIIHI